MKVFLIFILSWHLNDVLCDKALDKKCSALHKAINTKKEEHIQVKCEIKDPKTCHSFQCSGKYIIELNEKPYEEAAIEVCYGGDVYACDKDNVALNWWITVPKQNITHSSTDRKSGDTEIPHKFDLNEFNQDMKGNIIMVSQISPAGTFDLSVKFKVDKFPGLHEEIKLLKNLKVDFDTKKCAIPKTLPALNICPKIKTPIGSQTLHRPCDQAKNDLYACGHYEMCHKNVCECVEDSYDSKLKVCRDPQRKEWPKENGKKSLKFNVGLVVGIICVALFILAAALFVVSRFCRLQGTTARMRRGGNSRLDGSPIDDSDQRLLFHEVDDAFDDDVPPIDISVNARNDIPELDGSNIIV